MSGPPHFTGRHDLLASFKAMTLSDDVLLDQRTREASIIRMVDAGDEPRRAGRWAVEGCQFYHSGDKL